jgi:hypothetical protein
MNIMKYKLNTSGLLEDVVNTGKAGIHTAGFALSFLGLEYINEKFLSNSIQIPPSGDTQIFSSEFGFYAAQFTCFLGTGVEGIRCAYNTVKVPVKLVAGRYF